MPARRSLPGATVRTGTLALPAAMLAVAVAVVVVVGCGDDDRPAAARPADARATAATRAGGLKAGWIRRWAFTAANRCRARTPASWTGSAR